MDEKLPYRSLNQENIGILVRAFYPRVLEDKILAPFFIEKLGDNIENPHWKEHLTLLTEFWKFVALGFDDYSGNPLKPHELIQGLNREAFAAWLNLFHNTIDELFDQTAGSYLKDKSDEIAMNFMRKLDL